MKSPTILTIGSLDPEGRQGITADRSCITSLGYKPVNVVTGVFLDSDEVAPIEAATVERQLKASADFRRIGALKTGLLSTRENIEAVSTFLEDHKASLRNVVVDVCLESADESPYLTSSAISLLKMRLLPLATLAVAYLSEAERLAGVPVQKIDHMKDAAEAIRLYGAKLVLIKSDQAVEGETVDILYDGTEHQFLFTKPASIDNHRRRRDAFSAAIAGYLTKGYRVKEAVEAAKEFALSSRLVGQAEPA